MPMPRKTDPEKTCAECGTSLTRKTINGRLEDRAVFLKRRYCDRLCMAQGQVKEQVTLAGLRARSGKLRGQVCETCGTTEKLNEHHIDLNPANNDPLNRMTLCASCHQHWHWQHGKTMPRRQSVCKICGEPARKLDMCQKHYQRFRKYGDPSLTKKRSGSQYVLAPEAPGAQNGPEYPAWPAE